ncbi:MAG: RdgB/HAM1 family non-canonical purine NTP pyrophosphatase [Deinococcales bacterium]|nr:RdgB/HAM1 family non-canonical purine NTP pyrophosphatase [Deinococcales bacterium]
MTHPPYKLVLASSNPGKLDEFREALVGLPFVLSSAAELGVTRFPEETGAGYEENALVKAAHVALETGVAALADDSGLEVAALGGEPGVHTARYGGPGLNDGERMAHLLQKLKQVDGEARAAKFVAVIVMATPGGAVRAFRGESEGVILEGPRGTGGFGYDPVFYSPELGKSFAEASLEEKRSVSHRGRALAAFVEWARSEAGAAALGQMTPRPKDEE